MNVEQLESPSFFVFGAGRSGTTLLAFILSGQPGTLCLNDTSTYVRLAHAAMGEGLPEKLPLLMKGWRPATFRAMRTGGIRAGYYDMISRALRNRLVAGAPVPTATKTRFMQQLSRQYEHQDDLHDFQTRYAEPLRRAALEIEKVPAIDTRRLVATILSEIAAVVQPPDEVSFLGEKTPLHTMLSPWLLELYPHARAVLLLRDPITNVASIFKRLKPLANAVRSYDRFVPSMLWLADHPRVHAVSYLSLVNRTSRVMETIAGFLGLPDFDPSVPVRPFGKEKYTGNEVDPRREPVPDSLLDEATRRKLRDRHRAVYQLLHRLEGGDP